MPEPSDGLSSETSALSQRMIIYGINPVLEALRARRVTRLRVSSRHDRRIDEVLALAAAQ